jgi:hypothetical protein
VEPLPRRHRWRRPREGEARIVPAASSSDQSEPSTRAYVTRANFFNGVQRSLASLVGSVFRSSTRT